MKAPLSQDLRPRLIRAVEAGSSAREAALCFKVSASAAIKLVRRVRETGSTSPAQIGGYRKPLLAGPEARLRELTEAKPGITLLELQRKRGERGMEAGSLTTIWATLRRLALSHKEVGECRVIASVLHQGRTKPALLPPSGKMAPRMYVEAVCWAFAADRRVPGRALRRVILFFWPFLT